MRQTLTTKKDVTKTPIQDGNTKKPFPDHTAWAQGIAMLEDVESGRKPQLIPLHGDQEGLYEMRTNRCNRLIFQKRQLADGIEVCELTTFMLDHRHENLSVTTFPKNTTLADIKKNYAILSEAGALSEPQEGATRTVYHNGRFITVDEDQENALVDNFTSGNRLISAPAGGGKTLCASGLMQRFFEEAETAQVTHSVNDDDETDTAPTKKRILYVTESERLVQREFENFFRWDDRFMQHPYAQVEFLPYAFLAYRKMMSQPDAQYRVPSHDGNGWVINPDYDAWKKRHLTTRSEAIDFIKTRLSQLKKQKCKNSANQGQDDISQYSPEDIYREMVLNSATLNAVLTNNDPQAYLTLGERESIISPSNSAARQQLIEIYRLYHENQQNKIHLPFYSLTYSEDEKYNDVVFDEAQSASSAVIHNMKNAAQTRFVAMMDTNQQLNERLSVRSKIKKLLQLSDAEERQGKQFIHILLTRNYRTPSEIIRFINPLLALKNHLLGGVGDKEEYTQVMEPDDTWKMENPRGPATIEFCEDTSAHRQEITSSDFVVVVFVPENLQSDPKSLKAYFDALRVEYGTSMVFTPEQIKGLEFKTVLIHGAFDDPRVCAINRAIQAADNLAPETVLTQTQHRAARQVDHADVIATWFNTFYVCATRATQKIIIQAKNVNSHQRELPIQTFLRRYAQQATATSFADQQHAATNVAIENSATIDAGAAASSSSLRQPKVVINEQLFKKDIATILDLQSSETIDATHFRTLSSDLLEKYSPIKNTQWIHDFLISKHYQDPTLLKFRIFMYSKNVLDILSNNQKTPSTSKLLWESSDIFSCKGTADAVRSLFAEPANDAHWLNYIRIIKKLFEDSSPDILVLLLKTENLTKAEKDLLKNKVKEIARENGLGELLAAQAGAASQNRRAGNSAQQDEQSGGGAQTAADPAVADPTAQSDRAVMPMPISRELYNVLVSSKMNGLYDALISLVYDRENQRQKCCWGANRGFQQLCKLIPKSDFEYDRLDDSAATAAAIVVAAGIDSHKQFFPVNFSEKLARVFYEKKNNAKSLLQYLDDAKRFQLKVFIAILMINSYELPYEVIKLFASDVGQYRDMLPYLKKIIDSSHLPHPRRKILLEKYNTLIESKEESTPPAALSNFFPKPPAHDKQADVVSGDAAAAATTSP